MLQYFILLNILLVAGGTIYLLFFRSRLTPFLAKWFVRTIFAGACLLPFLLGDYTQTDPPKIFEQSSYNGWNVVNLNDPDLMDCYNKASDSEEQCGCEIAQKSKLMVYQPNRYYNALSEAKMYLFYIFLIGGILGIVWAILNYLSLIYWTHKLPKKQFTFYGYSFFLLETKKQFPICSFSIWNNFIVVNEDYLKLTTIEQNAVLWHELAHLNEKDTWQHFLLSVLLGIAWFNPFFFILKRELNELNELVADDWAIAKLQQPKLYAHVLIKAKEQQQASLGLLFAFAKSFFYKRVVRVLNQKPAPSYKISSIAFQTIILMGWLYGIGVFSNDFVHTQSIKLERYEFMKSENERTGLSTFCLECLAPRQEKTTSFLHKH